MAVVINPESELGKELAKWNKPYQYVAFPKMVYRAFKRDNGQVKCGDAYDEDFSRQCQMTVQNEDELIRAREMGWFNSPSAAIEGFEKKEQEIARAAAERHHADRRLGEKAQAEAKAADDATADHVADVPAPKRAPRGTRVG